jgi:nitronate monooxygenase
MGNNPLLERLGIELPIILAPMAGGPGTAELIAAVSNAGGLGSLGAAYLTPAEVSESIRRIRALTDRPFNVNLFAGGYADECSVDPEPMLALLGDVHRSLDLPAPTAPPLERDPFPEQLEAVLEARPAVFSFTFGIPDADALRRLRSLGITILGTATTVNEARLLKEAGVDAVVAQGSEAGAHRGTFAAPFEASMVPTLELVRDIAPIAPVIASGGIMDGRELAVMMANGASAAQLGTAFLTCPESGAAEAYKQALLAASSDTTVITRAFSGRPARGLANTFIDRVAGKEDTILPFPLQNSLTRPMRAAAARRGAADFLSLWAGQGVTRCRALPAAKLVARLMEEMKEVRPRALY